MLKFLKKIPNPLTPLTVAFLSLLPLESSYIGIFREFDPPNSDKITNIRLQRYTQNLKLHGVSKFLMFGEDARIFKWNDTAFALVTVYKTSDYDQILVNLSTLEPRKITHNLSYAGKNWMPVSGREELYFIRSIEPFSILKMSKDYYCEVIMHSDDPIGQYRGGAAAQFIENTIQGYGHKTLSANYHIPYKFTIKNNKIFTKIIKNNETGIIDPTSSWENRIVCCESQQNWWIPQKIVHNLYAL